MDIDRIDQARMAARGIAGRLATLIGEGSRRNFAARCGLSNTVLGQYLSGKSIPGSEALIAIADAAGVSIEWLASGRGQMRPQAHSQGNQGVSTGKTVNMDALVEAITIVLEYYKDRNKALDPANIAKVSMMIYEEAMDGDHDNALITLLRRDVS